MCRGYLLVRASLVLCCWPWYGGSTSHRSWFLLSRSLTTVCAFFSRFFRSSFCHYISWTSHKPLCLISGTIMTISKDRVKPSPLPDSWKLAEIFATGVILGSYLAMMTVIFFWAAYKTDFFPVITFILAYNGTSIYLFMY